MPDDRAAIYNLTQTFGGPGALYSGTRTTTPKTGIIVRTAQVYNLKKIVKLPRKMLRVITPVTQAGQKPFDYVREQVPFLLMASDLPTGVVPLTDDYIVQNGQGYTVVDVSDAYYSGSYLCMCEKITGDIPLQIRTIHMNDTLHFTESTVST